jgi:ABC-type multidrug transport system fused ATPase/permease subunit
MRGKTTILIAHHLQSIRYADLIVVLRAGKVVEQGTHDELTSRGGVYCDLFQIDRREAV